MKAHAEAIKRFYDDKAFAVNAYLAYDKQDRADIERVYDHYAQVNDYERYPTFPPRQSSTCSTIPRMSASGAQMREFDFRKVIDNSLVDRLVREGFFEKLFGPGDQRGGGTQGETGVPMTI